MDVKNNSGEISTGNKKQIVGNWRKGNPPYIASENITELCFDVLCK